MMVPYDGVPPQQAPPGVSAPSLPPPMPQNQHAPSPVMPPQHMHQQQMNPPYHHPGGHRRPTGGMPGQPFPQMPPQSPASNRQSSFGNMPGGAHQAQYSSHPPLHSPAPQPQQQGGAMHGAVPHPNNMRRQSGNPMQRNSHQQQIGMPSMQTQHDNMRRAPSSSGRQQSQYGSSRMGTSWQSDKDTPHRREMIQHIVKLLKKDKNGSSQSMNKLPQMAKQLEVSLYRNASSFEEYMSMTTLKKRLQDIADQVARKARTQSGDNRDERHWTERQQPYSNGMRGPETHQQPRTNSSMSPFMGSNSSSSHQAQRQVVNLEDINPIVGGNSMNGSNMRSHSNNNGFNFNNNSRQSSSDQRSSSSGGMSQDRNDPDWKMRIRHKQQRLLLLHHSAKCPHEDGTCNVTPHCAEMKKLWRHMEGCKDNRCRFTHCFSSRAILSHYRKCKDAACPACGPVRDTVRKSQPKPTHSQRHPRMNNAANMMPQAPMMNSMQNNNIGNSMNMSMDNSMGMNSSMSSSMNGRGISNSVTPQQPLMMPGSDPLTPSGVFSNQRSVNNSFQQPTQSSQASMPPPMQGQNNNSGMQFSVPQTSRYSSSSGGGRSSSNSVQQNMFPGDMNEGHSSSRVDNSNPVSLPTPTNNVTSSSSTSGGGNGGGTQRNETEWQKIRHKQQRLLLLRHASRCNHEATKGTKCPVTPHCAAMKQLWEHIALCKDSHCKVQHCVSSRYVLSHYRRCKDSRCPACGPVRETIKKAERERRPNSSSSPSVGSFDIDQSLRSNTTTRRPAEPSAAPKPERTLSQQPQASNISVSLPDAYQPAPKKAKIEMPAASVLPPPDKPTAIVSQAAPTSQPVCLPVPTPPDAQVTVPEPAKKITPKPEPAKTTAVAKQSHKSHGERSLLNSFTTVELETHLRYLNRQTQLPPAKLKSRCMEVLKGLQSHQNGWVFNNPVDPVELGLPDYFEIIKKPMDLGTIHKKLESGQYHALEDFQSDVNLTFDNAMTYNEKESVVYSFSKELKLKFETDFKKLLTTLESENQERRRNDRACTLCGCEKLLFEPPVFFCNGINCPNTRIRRNSHFYVGGNNQYFWCNQCYNELDGNVPIELVDMTITKSDLKKKKNDETHEESWVQCDGCERWVHQICGLFNTRQNKEHHSEYLCPACLLKRRTDRSIPAAKPLGASDLPRTTLSEYLERHIAKKVEQKKREMAEEKAAAENMPLEEATKKIELGGPVIIRQVTAMERKLEVRERMKKRYAHKNYPDEFPFRCKCLLVFQRLDGVDVVLFALYVYEHGEDNPPPNKRCVYISYLDSVHFMRPRKLRTFVYHEILISYLDYARRKGFSTAHIWACPPLKGDDYIFYAKPENQKTPRDSRLRQWYIDMLLDCQRRNIVGKVTNMYDLYFANEKLDATAVPYLEGDYFPGEAENIIKMIEEGGGKKSGGGGKKNKKKGTSKNRGGTRSTGVDEKALIASGILDGAKNLEELDRDQVMVKLGETILPMKDSFIVAYLNWSGAKEEDMVVSEDILKHRQEHPPEEVDLTGNKRTALGDLRKVMDKNGNPVKVIDDDIEDLDCEFFNNRQAFLNLCRGNHYQFDELRRAKHTSMMVLWHLHNRDAPKFVQQCFACSREILSGKRYHCPVCPDYDLCEECYKNPLVNRGSCTHKLQPKPVYPEGEQDGQPSGNQLTEAEREQRQRALMLHIQLIEHAARCKGGCSSTNCSKMKNFLQHAQKCKIKVQGGCKICKKIWTLLRIHAQKCKEPVCPMPQCSALREKMRQLQKQQQAMDDRRRLEMNRHYRMTMAAGAQN